VHKDNKSKYISYKKSNLTVYHLKCISLGSYALNKLSNMPDGYDEFVKRIKYNDTPLFADIMIKDFKSFFDNYNTGHIDLITIAQRSIRNIDKLHVMDIVGKEIASYLKADFHIVFEAWDKKYRGIHNRENDLQLNYNRLLAKLP